MSVNIGIMGFGRLGRNMFRIAHDDPQVNFAAVSDIADAEKEAATIDAQAALEVAAAGGTYIPPDLMEPLLADLGGQTGPIGSLSPRERQVLQLVADGNENKQIARHLDIAEATVKTYLRGVFTRLDVSSRAEAVAVGLRLGLIE